MAPTVTIDNFIPFLGLILGGGVGVALVSQALKKVFGLNSAAVIHTMVIAVSLAIAAAQYVFAMPSVPTEVLGISWTAIYGVSQAVYKYATMANQFLGEVQTALAAQKQSTATVAPVVATATADPAPEATPAAGTEFNQ